MSFFQLNSSRHRAAANRLRIRFMASLLIVAALILFGAIPASSQLNSRSGHITLIARMPETLGVHANSEDIFDDNGRSAVTGHVADAHNQSVIKSVTTVWCLARGRDRMVTLARVKQPNTPVLIALAVPSGFNPLDGVSDVPSVFRLPGQSKVLNTQLDAVNVTDANRVMESRISLSDSIPPSNQLPEDGNTGVVKIQLQAVP